MKGRESGFARTLLFILAISLFAFSAAPAVCEQTPKRDYWPTQDWKTLKKHLFEPLGIKSAYWNQDPQGYHIGGLGTNHMERRLAPN